MSDLDARSAWVQRVLGVTVGQRKDEAAAGPEAGPALQRWQAERGKAVASLRALSAAIVKSGDPEARDALILLQAIAANLTPAPDLLRAVAELERYVTQDDIIDDAEQPNPFGVEIKLREPLLPALAALRDAFAAAA